MNLEQRQDERRNKRLRPNGNRVLENAKRNKNDNFYTRLEDIDKELVHYKSHFKNKIIYLNCDDTTSNF